MGSSKSSRVVKTFVPKNKNETESTDDQEVSKIELSNESEETHSTELSAEDSGEKVQKVQSKSKKTSKKEKTKSQKIVFPNKSISNLSRGLGPNDWIKLANALGFLPQGIAHFTGRASSAQNSYSQCTLMLKTWRDLVASEEILPRLCDALQKIRRHDLAVKMGLELGVYASSEESAEGNSKLLLQLTKSKEEEIPPFKESKIIFTEKNVSFLARHLLAREEWKRLAYALGFYPDDASQIIASASSSQNLYAQAHLMLLQWRDKTPSTKIISSLRSAFIRIRRHDLVFLLDLGVIAGPEEMQAGSLEKLRQVYDKVKKAKPDSMGFLELSKFTDLSLL